MTTQRPTDDKEALAAEYTLRLLTGEDLVQAQHLVTTDPEFAALVTDWEIRLAAMTDELAPETPSPETKKAILATVFPRPNPTSIWQRVWIWQTIGAIVLVLFAVTFVMDLGQRTSVEGPLYTAEIATETGDFRVVAVVDKSTNEVFLTRTAGAAPQGRILQVWAHGEGAPAISVGLWPDGDTIRLPLPETIAAVEGILTLGVSEEPPGGSVTGSPSGRIFGTVDIPGVTGSI